MALPDCYVPPTLETINGWRVTVRQCPTPGGGYYSDVWADLRKSVAHFTGSDYSDARAKAEAWTLANPMVPR